MAFFNNQVNDSDSSSFNDEIPLSEKEYFSSDFNESNINFEKPSTRTEDYVFQELIKTERLKGDSVSEKSASRLGVLAAFRDFQKQQHTFKSIKRFQNVKNFNFNDVHEEANYLRDKEIVDKKLNNDYYYAPNEPEIYKKLLHKRRNAINRKYERYAQDPEYRESLQMEQIENLKYFENPLNPNEFTFDDDDFAYDSYEDHHVSNDMPIQTYGPWGQLNLSDILINESAIDFDTTPEPANFQNNWEESLLHLTHPDLMDDAINSKIDFNELAHERSIGANVGNLSLIEAFDWRVCVEQDFLKEKDVVGGASFEEKTKEYYWTNHPFLNAVKCLSLAEETNGIQIQIDSNKSTEITSSNYINRSQNSETFKPLEIISYVGTTKPIN